VSGRTFFAPPHTIFNDIVKTHTDFRGEPLDWWITENGLRIADNPPQGVFYVDAHGLLRNKNHQKIPVARAGWQIRYRSKLKQAILAELIKDPYASDYKISRLLDNNGAVDVPSSWKARSFKSAYSSPAQRHNIEVCISKVRQDLQKRGPYSSPVWYRGVSLY
jgi:hypothetical protein